MNMETEFLLQKIINVQNYYIKILKELMKL